MILDLSLTDISGPDGMIYICENYPEIPVLIFSANDGIEIISQCFERGVCCFVSKNTSMQLFVSAIRTILAGGTYIPSSAISLMGFEPRGNNEIVPDSMLETVQFTPKQHQVYLQLMQRVPNKIIAKRLDIAEGTVKAHLHSIYLLLRVNNRAQAILKSRELQIVDSTACSLISEAGMRKRNSVPWPSVEDICISRSNF
jgi:DNA-binding NarL/FixJ family response regulator